MVKSHKPALVALMILVGGLLPVIAYRAVIGRAPSIEPAEAIPLLRDPGSRYVLVDVCTRDEFAAQHIDGAMNWPSDDVFSTPPGTLKSRMPVQLRDKPLFLICQSGIRSARAALHLREAGVDAVNVRGGLAAWVAANSEELGKGAYCRLRNAMDAVEDLPFRESHGPELWAILSTFWVVKPFYLLLSLALVVILRRATSPDLVALRWGLLFFFLGEASCAANYFAFGDASFLTEYLHSFGMVLSFGFATYALFEGMDRRLIHYSDPNQKCAALGLCRSCPKYTDAPCGLKRLFLFLIPACAMLCFMPLTAGFHEVSYNTRVVWVPYNYSHPVIYQIFETRVCPLVALPLFGAAMAFLLFRKKDPVSPSKFFFAAGMGYLSFGVLRLFLFGAFRDSLVWFIFWEEITEFIYICGIALVLYVFRHALFGKSGRDSQ